MTGVPEAIAGLADEEQADTPDAAGDGLPGIYRRYGEEGRPEAGSEVWLHDKLAEAEQVVSYLSSMQDNLQALPEDADGARKELALARLGDVYGIVRPDGFSHEKFKAAYLVGRGLTQDEVASVMGVGLPELHTMMDDQFRSVVRHWRSVTLDDYFSVILRYVDGLVDSVLDPSTAIKLLRELRGLVTIPEERERWEAEMTMRERELQAREREVGAYEHQVGFASLISAQVVVEDVGEITDVDYEPVKTED